MSVGVDISAQVTPESMARFKRALDAIRERTKKSVVEIVSDLAFNFSREAYLRTRKGKPTISAKVDDVWKRAAASQGHVSQREAGATKYTGAWLWTWVKTRSGYLRLPMPAKWAKEHGLVKVGAYKRGNFKPAEWVGNRQVVRNRGFSKGGWIGIIKKLGKAMGAEKEEDNADAYTARWKFAAVDKATGNATAAVTIRQGVPPAVSYLDKRDNIMGRAMAALVGNVERMKRTHADQLLQSWGKA